MYIRRTLTRTLDTGAQYFSHRLVRSERVGGRVRQVTLLNLGSDFALGSSQWEALCARIEDLLSGHASPVETVNMPAVEVEAQRVAALLLARQSRAVPRGDEGALESVDLVTLGVAGARSVGVEQVALWAIRELRLDEQLRILGMPQRQIAAAVGLIVARMAAPVRTVRVRWVQRSALGELLGVDFHAFGPKLLERAAESLLKHRKVLESHLDARVYELFGLAAGEPIDDARNREDERSSGVDPVLTGMESVFGSVRPKEHSGSADARGDGEECGAAELFISVLACQCVQLVRRRLIAHAIVADWPTLRQCLADQWRVTVSVLRSDGRTLHLRQPTRADPEQLAIYQALGIDPAPGGFQKTII